MILLLLTSDNLINPAVPRLSFATRYAHIFAHIFATGNEIQKTGLLQPMAPRLSFATRFDTKLREKSFEKQYSAKAVLFTMYVPTVGITICTQICARTWAHYNEISHASAQVKTAFTEFWVKTKIFLRAEKYF